MDKIKLNINGLEKEIEADLSQVSEKGITLNFDDVVVKTKEDYDATITNLTGERYKAGLEVGEKQAVKKVATDFGIELEETKKTVKNFADVFKTKIENESKIEPEQKIKDALSEKEKALGIAQTWESKYTELSSMIKENERRAKINDLIENAIPEKIKKGEVKTKIPVNDIKTLYLTGVKISLNDEGGQELLRNGQKLQNPANLNNITVQDDFPEFVKNYIVIEGGGGGGDDTGANKAGTLAAFQKEMETKGITGTEFNREMQKRIKEGTLKV
jgi:hypothetical protein